MSNRVIGYAKTQRIDGLCERCLHATLIHVTIVILLPNGVSEHDRGPKCIHCDRAT